MLIASPLCGPSQSSPSALHPRQDLPRSHPRRDSKQCRHPPAAQVTAELERLEELNEVRNPLNAAWRWRVGAEPLAHEYSGAILHRTLHGGASGERRRCSQQMRSSTGADGGSSAVIAHATPSARPPARPPARPNARGWMGVGRVRQAGRQAGRHDGHGTLAR